jgi:hypothetical protein
VLLGTWGLILAWGTKGLPLDNVHMDLGDRLLLETGFPRPAPTPPPRVWHHSHTWFGHLSKVIEGRVGQSLSLLSRKARQPTKDTISRTILAGQQKTWEATQAMITRYLKWQKVIQRATDLQKPAPIFRRLYASLGPGQSHIPSVSAALGEGALVCQGGLATRQGQFNAVCLAASAGLSRAPFI